METQNDPETTVRRRLGKHWRRGAYVLAPLAAAIALTSFHSGRAVTAPAAPPSVTVAAPLVRNVDQWDEYVGRFTPSQSVDVRARVSGAVTALHFHDGQMVAAGQLLFSIDPRPYAAALAEARAAVSGARTTLELARADLERAERLQGDEAIAAGEIDGLRARERAAQSGLAAAQARARARELDMEFTQIKAPISGRISDRRVDVGNLIAGGDGTTATLLTTINTLDPIYFTFDSSEALYLKAKRLRTDMGAPVEVRLQDETEFHWKGRLDFTDNGVDPRSGTIRGRATIANKELLLTPGMFGNMRMASGGGPALLVPDDVIQADQADKTVLIVDANDVIAARTVKLGPAIDGLRIVTSGLLATDRIVVGGASAGGVGVGEKITPRLGSIAAHADRVPAPTLPTAAQATFAQN